jgi:uncharacterized protein
LQVRTITSLDSVPAQRWNHLNGAENPFLRHEFLHALERHGAVSQGNGWQPLHLLLESDNGELLGAAPAYLKGNSWGEFVFDWAWANAYERAGGDYYPKLVMAVPYTPATGPRVLVQPGFSAEQAMAHLAAAAVALCRGQGLSGAHCLFAEAQQGSGFIEAGWMRRAGCQFHWNNQGYADFDAFLDTLSNKKRKNIRRERRLAAEAGLTFRIVPGDQVDDGAWDTFHDFYTRTFEEHGNLPVLTRAFFAEIGEKLAGRVLMVQAWQDNRMDGAALLLRSDDSLYGRYWGCRVEHPGMHFETCYYQGIEYCIREGLDWFEPGAQGEHKIARGFLPRQTHSLHWIEDEGFRRAIADFLHRETPMVRGYMEELATHSPYKAGCAPAMESR